MPTSKAVYKDHMIDYRGVYSCDEHRSTHSCIHTGEISCLCMVLGCGDHRAVETFEKGKLCAFYLDNIQYSYRYIGDHTRV